MLALKLSQPLKLYANAVSIVTATLRTVLAGYAAQPLVIR
jgi:hypothetical protein